MIRRIFHIMFLFLPVFVLLGIVMVESPELPIGELAYQWLWVSRLSILFFVCIVLLGISIGLKKVDVSWLYGSVIGSLVFWGGVEAVWGLRQVYGFAPSNHSLYKLTGSFFNPGPYSGYLAMVFPLCFNEWLRLKNKVGRTYVEWVAYYLAGGVMLLILCVLPAGMSRSAWLAVVVSGLWIYGMHYSWGKKIRRAWQAQRKKMIGIAILGFIGILIGGAALFYLKRDSASGRLFMWKITCRAIAERPFAGYGMYGFAYAYGNAQEEYFAAGEYTPQEELVAGSPEYAFNEYLQVIVQWGIIPFLILLAMILFCLWRGIAEGRFGVCGGVISLLVFAFSSYPMHLPVFVVSFFFLLAACVMGRSRCALAVFALCVGIMGTALWKGDVSDECKEWASAKMLYDMGAYESTKENYRKLYPALKNRGSFLFEYGRCLHKLKEYEVSTEILKEAAYYNCDPMILNVIGKNYQQQGMYEIAEKYFIRSTHRLPGRIYPYYLLAKLYAERNMPEQMKETAEIVLTKVPKVQSTAIEEMRTEIKKILERISVMK